MHSFSLQHTADGSVTLSRKDKQQTYHSRHGAVTESTEVFLGNSDVQDRLQRQLPTGVLEIGFGSGLNFILTAHCAQNNNSRLTYYGCENLLPPVKVMQQLLQHNTEQCEVEIERLCAAITDCQTNEPLPVNDHTTLHLLVGDAMAMPFPKDTFHAVYLDAFSQSEDPTFWQPPFLKKLHQSLRCEGTLATYSVNRQFRNALEEAGFVWKKLPGPAGKREVIVATRQ